MNTLINLSQWSLLFGAIMPVLVGLVTKSTASASLKATTLLVLNAVSGVLTDYFASPNGFDWNGAIINAVAALITSVAAYYGFLKHTISPALNNATANFGIGGQRDYGLAR